MIRNKKEMITVKKMFFAVPAALLLALLCLTGCDKTMLKDEAATRAPERTTSMGDRIEQGLTNASERASEGLSEAGSRIRDGVTDASEALSDAMDGKRN
jgi:hypothetical protein